MRQLILIVFLSAIPFLNCMSQNQNNMKNQIKEIVASIEKAAANRNIKQLTELLHKDYRVVANRFKGSKNVTIIPKETYLQMMKEKKVGGTNYNINVKDIKIYEHTAIVDVLYISETTSDMHKYLVLIQDQNNQWKVVSDIPIVMD